MRKTAEMVSLAALAVLGFVTIRAFYGPHASRTGYQPTSTRRPVNGWGSSYMLLVFPVFAVAIYLLMSLVSRFPSAFNFPVRVTPINRQRLEALALNMIAWLKAESCRFVYGGSNGAQSARPATRTTSSHRCSCRGSGCFLRHLHRSHRGHVQGAPGTRRNDDSAPLRSLSLSAIDPKRLSPTERAGS